MTSDSTGPRCGIVLAAGEGERLRPFVHRLRGEALPKQYVNFVGGRSMLEHTFDRAERVIAPERLFAVVGRDHLRHPDVRMQLSGRPSGAVVVQPENRETAPGILLPLMHLCSRYPDPVVAVFPSDHFVLHEELFMAHVDLAYRVVERYPSYLVLLGMEPDRPEPEYGYILPGDRWSRLGPLAVRKVARFVEKPNPGSARELIEGGGLWNTMVMVFRAGAMLELVRQQEPLLYGAFLRISQALGTERERSAIEESYRQMEAVNFSRAVLEPVSRLEASPLLVLPVRGVLWSDWGSEQRIVTTLGETGLAARL
ncbi:MAG: NTP transferase domain-containing protein [Deltaproteobacteria bacterium]|nr:NTP transferase domain-containing protein [Deltaproteobacteria bacterium]